MSVATYGTRGSFRRVFRQIDRYQVDRTANLTDSVQY
jgi:hypothetical protein